MLGVAGLGAKGPGLGAGTKGDGVGFTGTARSQQTFALQPAPEHGGVGFFRTRPPPRQLCNSHATCAERQHNSCVQEVPVHAGVGSFNI